MLNCDLKIYGLCKKKKKKINNKINFIALLNQELIKLFILLIIKYVFLIIKNNYSTSYNIFRSN
jgi:hypothetical protein